MSYTPQRGSLAEKVIEHLTRKGGSITSAVAAEKFGVKPTSVSPGLAGAVDAGMLSAERVGRGFAWSLAAPQQVNPDAALQIATHADGDVVVMGHIENEDGSITFSRKRLQQLFAFVTTPHLVLTPAAATAGA